MDLAAVVAPTVHARERTLPVAAALIPLLPDGALVRGRTIACQGVAATSLALALAVEATAEGAWLAVVDLPLLGVEAAAELGIPLERLVRVDPGRDAGPAATSGATTAATGWPDLMAAVLDGFDVVITRVPARVAAGTLRRVASRVQSRGAVVILVDKSVEGSVNGAAGLSIDLTMQATTAAWEGAAAGHGHLRARRVGVEAAGRRMPRTRRAELWLPGPGGAVAVAAPPLSSAPSALPALRPVG